MSPKQLNGPTEEIERIYTEWDSALSTNDLDAALALYASDATIESPLIPHLLDVERGICRGHDELRRFIEIVFLRKPKARKHFGTGYLTGGTRLMWEYPRATPDGDQMDFVEVMEVRDGLIQHHRVYWGLVRMRHSEERPISALISPKERHRN
jgi:ketosteroid isomerase-like protein